MRPLILKITLDEIEPPVWRRVAVPSNILLSDLHKVIQTVIGWENCHLHKFRIGTNNYGPIDADYGQGLIDGTQAQLGAELDTRRRKFVYVYDFGDDWVHRIEVERGAAAEELARLPARLPECIEGERACPPEDCGGPWGYEEILEAIADPEHERHEEMREWVDDDFDAGAFNVAATNAALARRR